MIWIPISLMVASAAAILIVVVRKLPQLSLLDVENAPQIKEEKKKMDFLKKRVEAQATKIRKERRAEWQPVFAQLTRAQSAFRQYVGNVERMIAREKSRLPAGRQGWSARITRRAPAEAPTEDVRTMLQEGAFAFDQNDWETAEKKYLAVIRMDAKNKEAYLGLGNVYRKQGQADEARETYAFVAQLDPNDDGVRVKLAELAEEAGDTQEAIRQYEAAVVLNANLAPRFAKLAELLLSLGQHHTAFEAARQALDLEPENPKYLDMMVETSIVSGQKDAALGAYEALRMGNPENQKLPAFKDRIEKMPS